MEAHFHLSLTLFWWRCSFCNFFYPHAARGTFTTAFWLGQGNHIRDHPSITSAKRWVGGVRKWQFFWFIYADIIIEWSLNKRLMPSSILVFFDPTYQVLSSFVDAWHVAIWKSNFDSKMVKHLKILNQTTNFYIL